MEAVKGAINDPTRKASDIKSTFVVIGGGIAGVSCAEQLAVNSPEESILLITASPIVKAATNIVKLCRVMESFDIEERPLSYLEQQYSNIRVLQDVLVSLDASAHRISLKSGRVVSYGMICLCMGARPQLILKDNPLVMGIRDTETVQMLQSRLARSRLVAVIGNGGIATELVGMMHFNIIALCDSTEFTFAAGASPLRVSKVTGSCHEESSCDKPSHISGPDAACKVTVQHIALSVAEQEEKPRRAQSGSKIPHYQAVLWGPTGRKGVSSKVELRGKYAKPNQGTYWNPIGKFPIGRTSSVKIKFMPTAGGHPLTLDEWFEDEHDRKRVHVEYGCEVRLLLTPAEFRERGLSDASRDFDCGSNWPIYLLLTNDKCFGADLVVSATGVTPNTDAVGESQLALAPDGGVLVDRHMRASLPDVYAAGDVCTAGWEPAELWFQRRLWTQARQLGHWAGTCMAAHWLGEPSPLADARFDVFSHVTRFFGYRVVLLGVFNGQGLTECHALVRVTPGQEYIKLLICDGRLKGAVLIGDTDLEETCENLLLDQLDLGPLADHLLDPEVDIEDFFD